MAPPIRRLRSAALSFGILLMPAFVLGATIDIAGVKLEDRAMVGGSTLQLNGAGIRYKAVFKVYTAGLYLGEKATTP